MLVKYSQNNKTSQKQIPKFSTLKLELVQYLQFLPIINIYILPTISAHFLLDGYYDYILMKSNRKYYIKHPHTKWNVVGFSFPNVFPIYCTCINQQYQTCILLITELTCFRHLK